MLKIELRKKYLEKRKKLSEEEVFILSSKIIQNFILQFRPIENQVIHCFLPIKKQKEIDTIPLINYCFKNNIKVFIPKILENIMFSLPLNSDTILEESSWGILEPIGGILDEKYQINYDFILIPLLYCDNQGNRVGYGKGYYDSFLAQVNPNCKKIGLSYFSPMENIENVRDEDVSLDYLITPSQVFSFNEIS